MDFMELLEQAAEESRRTFGMDDGPALVARAQAAKRKAINEDPMRLASLVQQRPLQSQAVAIPLEEQKKKTEPMWLGFLWGFLFGAAVTSLVLIRVLV